MSQITKNALAASLKKLLSKKELSKIFLIGVRQRKQGITMKQISKYI